MGVGVVNVVDEMCNMSFRVRSNYENIRCKYVSEEPRVACVCGGREEDEGGIRESQHVKVGLVAPTIHPFAVLNWKLHGIRAFC